MTIIDEARAEAYRREGDKRTVERIAELLAKRDYCPQFMYAELQKAGCGHICYKGVWHMAGGRSPKRKGDAGEVEFCKLYGGQRTFWQPGKAKTPDVINLEYIGKGEIKRRARGFQSLYNWLADNDFLAVRADRKKWLVVMPMDDLKLLLDEMDELKAARL